MEEVALALTARVPGLRCLDEVSWGSSLGRDHPSPPPPPATGQLADLSPPTHRCTQTPCGWCRWGCPWPRHWTQLLKPHCRLQWSCAVGRESPACLPGLAWSWVLTLPWSLELPTPGLEFRLLFPSITPLTAPSLCPQALAAHRGCRRPGHRWGAPAHQGHHPPAGHHRGAGPAGRARQQGPGRG